MTWKNDIIGYNEPCKMFGIVKIWYVGNDIVKKYYVINMFIPILY